MSLTIQIQIVEDYPEKIFKDLIHRNLESDGIFIPAWDYKTAGDPTFKMSGQKIRIAAYDGEQLIGLSWGEAATKNKFMMNMSLVEPAYRRQGIYGKMLAKMLELTKHYDEVDSCHQLFNNSVIAAKLKQGFYIVGLDQSIMVGPRLRMRYFHNEKLLALAKFRAGLVEDPR